MKLKNNETDDDHVENKSIVGMRFIIRLVHDTANTAFVTSASLFNFMKLRFSATTVRNGKNIDNVKTTPLKPILKHLALTDDFFANIVYDAKNIFDVKVTQASGVKHQLETAFDVLFDGGIILKGKDRFEFEATVNDGFFVNANTDTNLSYVRVEPIYGVTKEFAPPMISVIPVKENAQNPTFALGNGVLAASFVNMSDAGMLDSAKIIEKVQIESDVLNNTEDIHDLIASKNTYQDGQNAFTRDQSFLLLRPSSTDYDGVTIGLDLDDSKVTLSDNYIVCYKKQVDPLTFQRQTSRMVKQASEKERNLVSQLSK